MSAWEERSSLNKKENTLQGLVQFCRKGTISRNGPSFEFAECVEDCVHGRGGGSQTVRKYTLLTDVTKKMRARRHASLGKRERLSSDKSARGLRAHAVAFCATISSATELTYHRRHIGLF